MTKTTRKKKSKAPVIWVVEAKYDKGWKSFDVCGSCRASAMGWLQAVTDIHYPFIKTDGTLNMSLFRFVKYQRKGTR